MKITFGKILYIFGVVPAVLYVGALFAIPFAAIFAFFTGMFFDNYNIGGIFGVCISFLMSLGYLCCFKDGFWE